MNLFLNVGLVECANLELYGKDRFDANLKGNDVNDFRFLKLYENNYIHDVKNHMKDKYKVTFATKWHQKLDAFYRSLWAEPDVSEVLKKLTFLK